MYGGVDAEVTLGWVTGIGSGMKIIGPENVKQQYKEYLLDVLQNY